ncbi:response regulator transcription factor [Chlorogloeopsis sp. ULAP02]|uniref:response regulator transcription factor n=1 Tax=Chlorogloeopsis sp. ULAP02 TaxID=3107926 RepID=UPI0031374C28
MYTNELTEDFGKVNIGQKNCILVVEDDEIIRQMIAIALQDKGYIVITVADGLSAFEYLKNLKTNTGELCCNLIILDLMLPGINGLDICRWLRHQGNAVPIIILSAKGSETDRILGLEIGADDYLSKPFGIRELVARCQAVLRRQPSNSNILPQTKVYKYKDITLNTYNFQVLVRNQYIKLSRKEFRLLELFISSEKRVWSRERLLDLIWGEDFVGDSKTVDVHICWLREKLELDSSNPEYIITVRGFGYRFGSS